MVGAVGTNGGVELMSQEYELPSARFPALLAAGAAQDSSDTDAASTASSIDELRGHVFELIYRQMISLTGGRSNDLDDLVQDAVEQALRALPSFRGHSKLSTWTYRIAYRTLLKHRRWYGRWLRRFSLSLTGELPEVGSAKGASQINLEEQERLQRLRNALHKLSPKRRTVVILHDLEGLGVGEIAEVVQAKVTTVRSRLRDGRKDLAQLLQADEYFGVEACAQAEESEAHP